MHQPSVLKPVKCEENGACQTKLWQKDKGKASPQNMKLLACSSYHLSLSVWC